MQWTRVWQKYYRRSLLFFDCKYNFLASRAKRYTYLQLFRAIHCKASIFFSFCVSKMWTFWHIPFNIHTYNYIFAILTLLTDLRLCCHCHCHSCCYYFTIIQDKMVHHCYVVYIYNKENTSLLYYRAHEKYTHKKIHK